MIIRAYVRHLVAPFGTQFIGECKSVFICGILTGAISAIMYWRTNYDLYPKGDPFTIMYGDIDSELYPKGRLKTIMLAEFHRIYLHRTRINSVHTTSYTPTRRLLSFSYTILLRNLSRPHTAILRSHNANNPHLHK